MALIKVLVHTHRHGKDIKVYRGGEELPVEVIARRLGLDYEADRDDEDLEVYSFDETEIDNVDEIPDPEPGEEEGEEAGDDLCDLCSTSGVNASRTTYCGKTIGVECGCDDEHKDGTCNDPECEECSKAGQPTDGK